jgi:hypothetical protein
MDQGEKEALAKGNFELIHELAKSSRKKEREGGKEMGSPNQR